MQNYFKYMMLTYLSKELHSFLNISVLFRKLFTDTYPEMINKSLHHLQKKYEN